MSLQHRIASIVVILLFGSLSESRQGKDDLPAGYLVDVSSIKKIKDSLLDVRIRFISKTKNGGVFDRVVKVNGPATENTAETVCFTLKFMYEADEWEFKEVSKTQLLIVGKKGSPIEKMEIVVEGLDKKFHPTLKQVKTK